MGPPDSFAVSGGARRRKGQKAYQETRDDGIKRPLGRGPEPDTVLFHSPLLALQGAIVAMTGDGVKRLSALKKADAGIAMGMRRLGDV